MRWHLACGDNRFFESTEHFGPTGSDDEATGEGEGPAVVLLQSVRALPRAGLSGCSIMIHNVTGVTRVSFTAAEDNPWAAVSDSDVLRDKLARAFDVYLLPDPEVVGAQKVRVLTEKIAAHRPTPPPVAPLDRRLRQTLDLPRVGPAPQTLPPSPTVVIPPAAASSTAPAATAAASAPLHERLGLTLGLTPPAPSLGEQPTAARETRRGHARVKPAAASAQRSRPSPVSTPGPRHRDEGDFTRELAKLLAIGARTADDLPDTSGDTGPITAIEALNAADVWHLRGA